MKSLKQIADRITALEARQKDGIDTTETIETLKWALNVREEHIKEELIKSVKYVRTYPPFTIIRCLLWIIE